MKEFNLNALDVELIQILNQKWLKNMLSGVYSALAKLSHNLGYHKYNVRWDCHIQESKSPLNEI
jgi:hypothetical protein